MRKASFGMLLLLLIAQTSQGQFYLNLGMGYAMPEAGQTLDGTGTPYNGTRVTFSNGGYSYSDKSASFSSGVQGKIGLGYMVSANFGFELDAVFGISPKKYTFNDDSVQLGTGTGTVPGTESIVQKANAPIIMEPSIVLQTGGEKVNLYCRVGLALPLSSQITEDQIYSNLPGTGASVIDDYTYTLKNSFGMGFAASAGFQYRLSDRVKIWGELSMLSLSLFIRESDLQSWNEFSGGQWSPVPIAQYYQYPTTVKYSKNVTIDSSLSNLPAYSQPFSNVALMVGVTFTLGEKHEHHSKHRIESTNDRLRRERDN